LLDWAAHLFRCQRYQYVIVTNTQTLFSFVCHGQGICDISSFVDIIMSTMREVFENYGFVKAFDDRLAPNAREMILTKVGDRSLTGCMNNIVGMSQFWLERDHLSPMDLQPRINEIPINRKGVKEVIVGRNELSRAIGIPDNTMPYWQPALSGTSKYGLQLIGQEKKDHDVLPSANSNAIPQSREPGVAAAGFIPLSVPEIRGNEWKYLKDCLDTNWVSSAGPYVARFEQDMATRLGVEHAVAVSTGTAALHLALQVAGVGPDDEVLVPALTFVATANAVRYLGAWPVFLDVDPDHWQLDPVAVAGFLRENCELRNGVAVNRISGRKVKAIIPVDLLGHPANFDPIAEVAHEFGLTVIEDATESLGALYQGRPVGALGDLACLSFNGNKLITTGGGGMILTARRDWAEHARYLSTQAKDDPVEYLHREIGYNYRLTNLQAAMGCAQLEQLDVFLAAKRTISERYQEAFAKLPGFHLQAEAPWARSAWWLPTVRIDPKRSGTDSRTLMHHLKEHRIQTRPLWTPLHLLPPYQNCQSWQIEHATALQRECLSLPSSVGLKPEEQRIVVREIQKAVRK